MKKINIYCDGSSLGNPGFGGWCAILQYKNVEKILSGSERKATNNQMELKAVLNALGALKESCEINLYTDSKYVCDGINSWLKNWIKNNFKNSQKKPIANINLWKDFINLSKHHKIKAIWVRGHSGDAYNEKCDRIAKNEAMKLKESE